MSLERPEIIIYSKIVHRVSGLHTFEKALIKQLSKFCNFRYVYDAGDPNVIDQFRKLCPVIKNNQQIIRGDICIYSSIYHEPNNIQAKKFVQIYHSELSKWDTKPNTKDHIDVSIAVSPVVQKDLKEKFNIDSEVIPNLVPDIEEKKVIRFLTATRLDVGKGLDRILILVRKLREEGLLFSWDIYGDGANTIKQMYYDLFKDYPEVSFKGYRSIEDMPNFMRGVDYVAQLSDAEGFCYSVYESLQVGTPVIVTNWEGVNEVVEDGLNGHIIDMNAENVDVHLFYDKFIACGILKKANDTRLWRTLFNLLLTE